jgi:formylglycine-generating enzyme required for sulfatase activity
MKSLRILSLIVLLSMFETLSVWSQGVIVYKKDDSKTIFPYEQVDSIVTFDYDDDLQNVTEGVRTFTVNGVSFTMLKVVGGTFKMGATAEQTGADSDESPVHNVTLSDYYIGETEVTQELWTAVMGTNPSSFIGDAQRPVESVSWNDCQTFITMLNDLTGENFRLPTEAEWEYAARGGNQSKGYLYSGSNTIADVAWYRVNSYDKGSSHPDYGTHAVKTKFPNELGLYDMLGNVWEWCQDWYGSYSSSAVSNPTGPALGSSRVKRGGSWYYFATYCRVANRFDNTPDISFNDLGFRLAL